MRVLNNIRRPTALGDNVYDLEGTVLIKGTFKAIGGSFVGERNSDAYGYIWNFSGDMSGGAAQKTYLLNLDGERVVGDVASGDSNDSIIKSSYNNYAPNDANFIIRGINSVVNNRSGGELGILEGGQIGAQNKSGGVALTIRGLSVIPENYGTNADEFGGLDVVLKNESNAATLTYGARIRNIDASAQSAIQSALLINSTATNGFDNIMTIGGKADTFADFDDATGEVCTESGSAATGWSGRIKIVTPDGNDAWINVYDTSNA